MTKFQDNGSILMDFSGVIFDCAGGEIGGMCDIYVVVKTLLDLKVGLTFAINVCMALLGLFVNFVNNEEIG